MKKEEAKIYAAKYRKVQTRLSIVMACLIILIGFILIAGGIIIGMHANGDIPLIVVACIMFTMALADAFLAIKFVKWSRTHYKYMSDRECAEHYCKIHGFNSKMENEKKG